MDKITNLFHDCGYLYLSTIEPDIDEPVTVRIRTVKGNVTNAWVEISHDGKAWDIFELQYEKEDRTGYFSYFKGEIPGQKEMFKYRFRAQNRCPGSEVYYTRTYIGKEEPIYEFGTLKPDDYWTLIPGYHTPDWTKGIIWYSVMPDAFYNGDLTNDEPISGENFSNPWNMPQHNLRYKYGGDLKGIEKKLDYIKDLGCEAVFMNPIFKSSQNAGYGPEFYRQIEHSFGNRQALLELAKALHERGMYYMLDVVLTFVAVYDIWYNKENRNPLPAAAQDWDSEYHDFFYFTGEEGDTTSYKSDWGGVKLNFNSEKLRDFIYREKDSYLKYYCENPFHVDAIRFDCGGSISGTRADGTPIKDWEILGEIRKHLHEINPNIMLLSEYSFSRSVEKGVWDSRWNLEFVIWGQKYMLEEIPESVLFQRFNSEIYNVPRAFAHCQYHSMNDHDRPRKLGIKPYAFRAFQLIHMTQIGAPSIYFGDEIRNQRERGAFYAMEWNEADWDYKVLHDTKALTELRKKYSALRDGIIQYLCVDDDNHIMAFARMNEESTVVTVSSRSEAGKYFAVNVRELGEADGTVFTDWFSGKQYTSKDGYLDVILPAGGTIFVKGEASSTYRGGFAIQYAEDSKAEITAPKDNAIHMNGKGAFVYTEVFNAFDISTLIKNTKGTGMLLVCADNHAEAAFIGAEVRANRLTVFARTAYGKRKRCLISKEIPLNSYIRIQRDDRNQCSVSVTRTPGGRWENIISGVHVDLPNHAKAGMTVKSGKACFENIRMKYVKESVLCDDFKQKNTAMFDFAPDMDIKYSRAGLVLTPQDGIGSLLTNAYDEDWTFKTSICMKECSEGEYAGVICRQDANIFVIAGRMRFDRIPVFFIGRATDGTLQIYHILEDKYPNKNAVVQLQRIGTAYSAICSYDEKRWKRIGENIIANLCVERVGIVVSGKNPAVFRYVSFGNAIYDGVSFHTPRTPDIGKFQTISMKETMKAPKYEVISGIWNYAKEGYVQTSKGIARLGISNKVYTDFKIDGTYVIDEGTGYVGFEFGKQAYDSVLGDGYLFKVDSSRTVSLEKSGETMISTVLPDDLGNEIRLCVENRNGVFAVFVGLEGKPLFVMRDFEKTSGYVCYVTEGIKGHINNYLTASYDANFYFDGAYENLQFASDSVEKNWLHTHAFINPLSVGVTDFEVRVKMTIKQFGNTLQKPYAGLYLCSPEGKFGKDKALSLVVDHTYKLLLKNGDEVLASTQLEKGRKEIEIHAVMKAGTITAYTNQAKDAVIIYERGAGNGGVVSLCANMATVCFEHMVLRDLSK